MPHCHNPWHEPPNQSPPLDGCCVFSQWLKIKSHGSMGPHVKQTNVTSGVQASYTLIYMRWQLIETRGRAHLPQGSANPPLGAAWRPGGPRGAPPPSCMPPCSSNDPMAVQWRFDPMVEVEWAMDRWCGTPLPPPINRGSHPPLQLVQCFQAPSEE